MRYSELAALERFADRIVIRQFGRRCLIEDEPDPEDLLCARRGLEESRRAVVSGRYRLIVLDEANVAVALGLFPLDELAGLIDAKPEHVELVLTGRWAHDAVLARADLVTEMREVKHYYRRGVLAREGIER